MRKINACQKDFSGKIIRVSYNYYFETFVKVPTILVGNNEAFCP